MKLSIVITALISSLQIAVFPAMAKEGEEELTTLPAEFEASTERLQRGDNVYYPIGDSRFLIERKDGKLTACKVDGASLQIRCASGWRVPPN